MIKNFNLVWLAPALIPLVTVAICLTTALAAGADVSQDGRTLIAIFSVCAGVICGVGWVVEGDKITLADLLGKENDDE